MSGDYIDARLYVSGDSTGTYMIVVRRQHEVVERFPVDASRRRQLATAIARGDATEQMIGTRRAGVGFGALPQKQKSGATSSALSVRLSPESALLAGIGLKGNHSLLSVTF